MKYRVYNFLILLVLVACNEFEVPLNNTKGLTVEAYIEAGKTPKVYLTSPIPISGAEEIDLAKAIEGNAKVEISDGTVTEIAIFDADNSRYPNRYYRFLDIKGKVGGVYTLTITLEDVVYEGVTTIPVAPVINEVSYIEKVTHEGELGGRNIKIDFKKTMENQYCKIFIKRRSEEKYAKASPFLVNNLFSGGAGYTAYIDYMIEDALGRKVTNLHYGEEYSILVQTITEEEYNFWKSLLGDATTLVKLPSFSLEVPTNISNGAFGFWGGYSSSEELHYKIGD